MESLYLTSKPSNHGCFCPYRCPLVRKPYKWNPRVWRLESACSAQSCLTLSNPVDCSPPVSLSMEFSRQKYWSGLPFPTQGDLPDPGIEPTSLASSALAGRFFTIESLAFLKHQKPSKLCFYMYSFLWLSNIPFGEGNGNPLQYSYLENPMDGGAWQATVHGIAKSRTRLT